VLYPNVDFHTGVIYEAMGFKDQEILVGRHCLAAEISGEVLSDPGGPWHGLSATHSIA
jgi:hypothetical protein